MRGILEVDPPAPTLDAAKRSREIDAIVLTALRKLPSGRYASAREMAEDIERYLSGRPVRAHGDSRGYRLRKFVRRNRAGVFAAALVLLSLLGGIIATTRESRIANAERARAEQREKDANSERKRAAAQAELAQQRRQQAETAQAQAQARASDVRGLARDLLVDLQETVSRLPGGGAAHEQLVNRAIAYLQRLEKDSSGEPELELAIALGYRKLGDLYNYIYRPGSPSVQRQLDAYQKSADRARPLLAKQPRNPDYRIAMAAAESGAGAALARMNRSKEAVSSWRRAMQLLEGIDTAEALGMRGATQMHLARRLWQETSQPETPLRMARQAVDWKRAAAEREPNQPGVWRLLANQQGNLALVLGESGDYPGSLSALKDANASLDKALLQQPDDFLARRDRVVFLLLRGNFESRFAGTEQAVATFQKAAQEADRLLEIDPGNVNVRYDSGNAQNWMGLLMSRMGKTTQARQHFQKQIEAFTVLTKDDKANLALREGLHGAYLQLGDSLADENRYPEAEPAYRSALAESEQMVALSGQSPAMLREHAFSCGRLAEVGLNTGNARQGLDWARRAVELHGKTVAAEPRNAEYLLSLSLAWGMQGQIERRLRREGGNYEELDSYRRGIDLAERSLELQPNDREKMSFLAGQTHTVGQRLLETGAAAEAATTLRRGRELLEQLTGADPKVVRYKRDLALVLSLLGEAEQADKAKSCSALRQSREMALVLEKDAKRPNPLLAPERFTRLMAGCESR
jgi:tetratricopeptide (TPR) repeat protein